MACPRFTSVVRGTHRTLVHDGGAPIVVELRGWTIRVAPEVKADRKTYATLVVAPSDPAWELVRSVDAEIRRLASPEYSPVLAGGRLLVIKVLGSALVDGDLAADDVVDASLKLGNYARFGYCWTATALTRPYRAPPV